MLRVSGTIGHADYLGNFLLYTSPIGACLAFSARRRLTRLFAALTTLLTAAAIVCSGTRGAWIGLGVSLAVYLALEARRLFSSFSGMRWEVTRRAAAVLAAVVLAAWAVSSSPASEGLRARAGILTAEGLGGSGRVLLWRDSIKMVPAFPLAGCGPEGFRKAFLKYKSEDLARLAPQTNNESSHNSYLDAAISFGLPGAVLFIAVIVSTVSKLVTARRQTND